MCIYVLCILMMIFQRRLEVRGLVYNSTYGNIEYIYIYIYRHRAIEIIVRRDRCLCVYDVLYYVGVDGSECGGIVVVIIIIIVIINTGRLFSPRYNVIASHVAVS